jgi:hypothetical protein
MKEESSYPSLPEQASNLANFSFNVVRSAIISNDSPFASDEIQSERWRICKSCEYYDPRQFRCRHCGCFLEAKIKFTIDSCPLQKWTVSNSEPIIEEKKINQISTSSDFPTNPSVDEIFEKKNESGKPITWKYDGKIWRIVN